MSVSEIKKANGEVMRIIDGEYVIGANSGCFANPSPCRKVINGNYLVERKCVGNLPDNPCGVGRWSNFNGWNYNLNPAFTYCSYCSSCVVRTYIFERKYYDELVDLGVVFYQSWTGANTYTINAQYKDIYFNYANNRGVIHCNYYKTKSDELIGFHTCWENIIVWVKA